MAEPRVERAERPDLSSAERLKAQINQAHQRAVAAEVRQVETAEDLMELGAPADFNPMEFGKRFQGLDKWAGAELIDLTESQAEEATDRTQRVAQKYQDRNPELSARTLLIVREYLNEADDVDTLIRKIQTTYSDVSLADEAIDFIIEVAEDSAILSKLQEAKKKLNEDHGVAIRSGRNIQAQAQAFSKEGLGSPTALRDIYRGIVHNPDVTPYALFDELTQKFSYDKMRKVIDFVLHSLGADMKAKGPSISRPELQNLFTEARLMQAIIGVYDFFEDRMGLIASEFAKSELSLPSKITFQNLAKIFMKFIQEKYPSASKVVALANLLAISEEVVAQIIIFMQYRDALRNVSPRLFVSDKHRQNLLMAFIEALTDLEEEEEKEEEEQKEKKKKPPPREEDTLE